MRVIFRLSLLFMLAAIVSACAAQGLPPLARTVALDAAAGASEWPAPLLGGGGGLALGAGVLAGLRRRRRSGRRSGRRADRGPAAGWSVVADAPGLQGASFSLVPTAAPHPHDDANRSSEHDADATVSWLGDLGAPQEPDDDRHAVAPEPDGGATDTPWWADDDSQDVGAELLADAGEPDNDGRATGS